MVKYNDQQIYENRKKWIDYLKQPSTQKYQGFLENTSIPVQRCCIGHACHVLGLKKIIIEGYVYYGSSNPCAGVAPPELIDMLGLWTRSGRIGNLDQLMNFREHGQYSSLARVNDTTEITPQEIGEYLESVIWGGEFTPFRPIYKEPLTYQL